MSHTAVVILNYNGEKLLPQFLPSVIQHSANAEVIVADNASTDRSVLLLRQQFPSVRVIRLDRNYGFCGGYNRALQHVDADYYVLLNSDVEVTDGWLAPIISLLDVDPSIAAVQPKILSYNRRNLFEYAGAGGGYIDSYGYPFCRGRVFETLEEDTGQYNDVKEIFWATGACLVIRSDVFTTFRLDEDFFAHMEEIDLCWKIHRSGKRVMYCGHSHVFHLGAATLEYTNPGKTYLNFRNGLFIVYRHFSGTNMLLKFPVRIGLDWLAALTFLFQGKTPHFKAVCRAHWAFIRAFRRERKKKWMLHRHYPAYSTKTIYRGSIVFDYFVRKKRRFTMDQ